MRKKKGYTLIELLVYLAIIGMLVMFCIPVYLVSVDETELTRIKVECKELGEASMKYYGIKGDWPRQSEEAYSAEEVKAFGERIVDETGETVILNAEGKYYDIDYEKLGDYVSKPEQGYNYVLQNPLGRVYGVEKVEEKRKKEYIDKEVGVIKPEVSLSMSPEGGIRTGVKQVAATWGHTVALMEDGTVKAWGSNDKGQLGDGTRVDRLSPVNVVELSGVVQIATSFEHTVALLEDGIVRAWGSNDYGQLGVGDAPITAMVNPIPVLGLRGVSQIATGGCDYTVALMGDGTVRAWGRNEAGQLGDGTTTPRNRPVKVLGLSGVVQIVCGYQHTIALMGDGTVKAWGGNYYGELGDGTTKTDRLSPVTVEGLTGVKQVAGGNLHTVALLEDGTVKAWGWNQYGQLGEGTKRGRISPVKVEGIRGVKQIAVGGNYTVALLEDGTVREWGYNGYGQLGDETTTTRLSPVKVEGIRGVKQIAVGGYHTVALLEEGVVKTWGDNRSGQLGDGARINRVSPVSVLGLEQGERVP